MFCHEISYEMLSGELVAPELSALFCICISMTPPQFLLLLFFCMIEMIFQKHGGSPEYLPLSCTWIPLNPELNGLV